MKSLLFAGVAALSLVACGQTKQQAANAQNKAAPAAANSSTAAPANTAQASPAGASVTPAEVRAMIGRDGARATVATLNQGGSVTAPNRLTTVMNGIAAGEQAWLDLVPLLRQGTDGETGEGLVMSIAEALPRNAAGVLRLMNEDLDALSVCSDLELGLSAEESRAYRQTSIAAVEAVTDPALQQAKTACLAELRKPAPAAG